MESGSGALGRPPANQPAVSGRRRKSLKPLELEDIIYVYDSAAMIAVLSKQEADGQGRAAALTEIHARLLLLALAVPLLQRNARTEFGQ